MGCGCGCALQVADSRKPYEDNIKRTYFHVKALDQAQLLNWVGGDVQGSIGAIMLKQTIEHARMHCFTSALRRSLLLFLFSYRPLVHPVSSLSSSHPSILPTNLVPHLITRPFLSPADLIPRLYGGAGR